MGISDRLLGKKNANGKPHIEAVVPRAALPGGEVRITGNDLRPSELRRPRVRLAKSRARWSSVLTNFWWLGSRRAHLPGPSSSLLMGIPATLIKYKVAVTIAENLHPVTNPALDAEGNIFVSFSGCRGQKVPVSIFTIDTSYNVKPFLADLMNATSIAFDRNGQMYVSSRFDGTVYRVAPNGTMTSYAEGMGIATGIAFDRNGNLYVGDRSGTIFKIDADRQIFVFATLEPSVSAYHLAFDPHGNLFVTGPTTSSFDSVYKVDTQGNVSTFYRGLGRPQGMAFDVEGNVYVAASLSGKRGIVKITPTGQASLEVAGAGLVGLAFAPGRSVVLATNNAVHHLAWNVQGLPLVE